MKEVKFLNKNTRLTNYSTIPNDLYGEGISSTAMVVYAKLLNRANLIFVKAPESSLTDGKPAIYGTDNKPFNGGKTNHTTGGKSAPNNYKNKTNIITNYNFEEGESL